jgi:hypothetical protein
MGGFFLSNRCEPTDLFAQQYLEDFYHAIPQISCDIFSRFFLHVCTEISLITVVPNLLNFASLNAQVDKIQYTGWRA